MNVEKLYVRIFCFLFGLFVVVLPCIILIATGAVSPEIRCFALDSIGRIYIGRTNKIDVYEDGRLINSFSSKTSKSYEFTILSDDTILLSTSTTVYSMDLNGNVLDSHPDTGTFMLLRKQTGKFLTQAGDTYEFRCKLLWPRIVKNGENVVYKISTGSFVVRCVLGLSVICFVVFLVRYVVIPTLTQEKTSTNQYPE